MDREVVVAGLVPVLQVAAGVALGGVSVAVAWCAITTLGVLIGQQEEGGGLMASAWVFDRRYDNSDGGWTSDDDWPDPGVNPAEIVVVSV